MYFRKKTSGGRAYLQIVESRREGAAVRQQVIATLGRVEDLRRAGNWSSLLALGARFADKAIVLDAFDRGEATVDRDPTHRAGARLRAAVGRDRLPGRARASGERAQP